MDHQPRPIVVGFDGSAQAHDALAAGAALAKATGEPLTIAGAYGPAVMLSQDELDARGQEVLERLDEASRALGPEPPDAVEITAVPGPSPAAALQLLAESEHPRAVVLGSCHHGPIGKVLIGSTAQRLLNGAPCPVVVAPRGIAERGPLRLRTVCVGFDARAESWAALQRAAQLASAAGAHLRVVMALPPIVGTPEMPALPPEVAAERERRAQIELDRAVKSVAAGLEAESRLVHRDAEPALAEESERDVDLIVTGSRGYGPLRRVLLGSVSTALMRSSACPVMVVPRSAEFEPTAEGMAADDELARPG